MTSYLSALTITSVMSSAQRPRRGLAYPLGADLAKRAVDLLGLVALLPLVALVVVPLMAVLWWQGGGVFYSQTRVGQGGRAFRLWKFRTMRPDADAVLEGYLARCPAAAAEWARTGKLRDDPRIRRGGRFMRRMSLDELPQLWNVARGEMSLVGPRPVLREELDRVYGAAAGAYMSCVPGLSGLWQVSGRNRLGYAQRVALDCHYAQHRSMALDIWIMGRTFGAVLRGSGC